jgi:hypothetical protein
LTFVLMGPSLRFTNMDIASIVGFETYLPLPS